MPVAAKLGMGVAQIDITPPKPVPLAGFACRDGVYEGIRRPLYARIFYFTQNNKGKKRQVVLITADLIWWETSFVKELRRKLASLLDLVPQDVLFHGTHNHSGPQTGSDLTPSLGKPDAEYLAFLAQRVLDGVGLAKEKIVPVTLSFYQDRCNLAVNRRKRNGGKILMQPCFSGPVDPKVSVLRFRDDNHNTVGLLVHYACHATTTADNWVSSEFPGVAMEKLEAEYNCVAGFLQGCCADVRPALLQGEEFFRGSEEHVNVLGSQLYNSVCCALKKPGKVMTGTLNSRLVSLKLPLSAVPSKQELETAMTENGVKSEWARILLNSGKELSQTTDLEIMRLDLAQDLSLLGLSGEIAVKYGLLFKKQAARRILPMGYTNGMTGYIPTTEQLKEGGYEAHDAAWYFALPSPFAPEVEPLLLAAVKTIMGEDELDE